MNPLCFIETPFIEKFGVPRQPLLIEEAWGKLVFPKDDFYVEAFRGIETFSHLWLIFDFHQIQDSEPKALIRPPRFENKKKMGVFATRSPHRPNHLGLSVVKFDKIEITPDEVVLWVKGVDLVTSTPIYDIKPYLPYVDAIPEASALSFEEKPQFKKVVWEIATDVDSEIKTLIEKVIALDPRPGYDRDSQDEFGLSVAGWNVRFRQQEGEFRVVSISQI